MTADLHASAEYRDTNGRCIVVQMGGVNATSKQQEGMISQKHRDRNRCSISLYSSKRSTARS